MASTWLAWRFDVPSILALMLAGFAVGPAGGLLDPDALFGDLLPPIVSLAVGIILFEGGLNLRTVELEEIGSAVGNLVTIGVVTTGIVTAVAAYTLLGLPLNLSVLLGAILVVTGPTVVMPLLRHLRPKGNVGKVLKWEGILIDPIGVVLAVLVFEAILAGGVQAAAQEVLVTMGSALLAGVAFGILGAVLLAETLRRHWIPDHLENPTVLGLVVAVFTACEVVLPEAGLIGTTMMGFVLANQEGLETRSILEFKENLRVLLISFLFVVLAARLEVADLAYLSWSVAAFLGVLFLVARPLGVFLSTIGTKVTRRGRLFLAAMAPRGIVAAAVSSVFAIELSGEVAGAEALVPITFVVIIATVAVYGLSAGPVARWLDVADPNPQGALFVGASDWTIALAEELDELGVKVLIADTNPAHLWPAQGKDLPTYEGSLLRESALEELELGGIGKLLAVTPNDQTNTLATLSLRELFDRRDTFQLAPGAGEPSDDEVQPELRGRILFGEDVTFDELARRFGDGWEVVTTEVPDDQPRPDFSVGGRLALAVIKEDGSVEWVTTDHPPSADPGDCVIQMVPSGADELPETRDEAGPVVD
jgi:NhaP-type Na+/H+ or K+/H+ antiporter